MGYGRAKATNLAAKWRCDDDDAICSQANRGRVVVPRRAFAVRFPVEPCVLQGDAERLGESLESEVWGWLLSCGAEGVPRLVSSNVFDAFVDDVDVDVVV